VKEPEGHYEDDYGDCYSDGDTWPCATIQKWYQSKDYRIQELEKQLAKLSNTTRQMSEQLRNATETLTRLALLLDGGISPAIADMGRHGRMGVLNVSTTVECEDHTLIGGPHIRVARRREYNVDYHTVDGRKLHNGECVAWEPPAEP
jgi:hypothetical protein